MRRYDIVVVGAGVAGLTAAATAARHGAGVLVIDRLGVGGQVITVERIENFPGAPEPISGIELGPMLQEQAEAWGAELMLGEVASVSDAGHGLMVECDGEQIGCGALIVAAGSTRRKLGVPGEDALEGRGVSHCASCDGPMFRGMKVLVVGGGDSGFDEALVLAEHAEAVTLVFRGSKPRAQRVVVEKVAQAPKISLRPRTTLVAVEGDGVVKGVRLKDLDSGEDGIEPADGVFVYIGLAPNTGFLGGLVELDEGNRVRVDREMQASHPRVFAAGDIRSGSAALLASCVGDGATAAVAAVQRLAREGDIPQAPT